MCGVDGGRVGHVVDVAQVAEVGGVVVDEKVAVGVAVGAGVRAEAGREGGDDGDGGVDEGEEVEGGGPGQKGKGGAGTV